MWIWAQTLPLGGSGTILSFSGSVPSQSGKRHWVLHGGGPENKNKRQNLSPEPVREILKKTNEQVSIFKDVSYLRNVQVKYHEWKSQWRYCEGFSEKGFSSVEQQILENTNDMLGGRDESSGGIMYLVLKGREVRAHAIYAATLVWPLVLWAFLGVQAREHCLREPLHSQHQVVKAVPQP